MNVPRRVAAIVALIAWIYSWDLFRRFRIEYAGGVIGAMPRWLLVMFGLSTTSLIAAMIVAKMRVWFWPAAAVSGSLFFAAGVIGGHYALMNSIIQTAGGGTRSATITDALNEALRTRSGIELVLITALPTLLLLAGGTGLLWRTTGK